MIALDDDATVGDEFFRVADRHADASVLAVPPNPARAYSPMGREIAFGEAALSIRAPMRRYTEAGYGVGHRVGLLLENRPEQLSPADVDPRALAGMIDRRNLKKRA